MSAIRRAALRAISSTSTTPLARNSRTLPTSLGLSPSHPSSLLASARLSRFDFVTRRSYATEDEQPKKQQDQSIVDSAVDAVSETAEKAKNAVSSAVSAGMASVTPDSSSASYGQRTPGRGDRGDRGDRNERRGPSGISSRPEAEPSKSLYVGNLYFEVTEQTMKREFEKYGSVSSAKIIYDGRGLSKGFGYIEFADLQSATAARDALDGQVLEGRRLAVQYAVKAAGGARRTPNAEGFTNPPSKTLFIGNMSYEMSDKDLNDLFRDIKNVLDVRVAIDRRTGQPRGFAHADFIDVKSAESAAAYLKTKEFYGRNLRIDFSANASTGGARERTVAGERSERDA